MQDGQWFGCKKALKTDFLLKHRSLFLKDFDRPAPKNQSIGLYINTFFDQIFQFKL